MIDWTDLAKYLGYSSSVEMLRGMYEQNKMTASEIGEKLGVSMSAVRLKLTELKIELRPRGGANYKGSPKKRRYELSDRGKHRKRYRDQERMGISQY